MTVDDIKGKLEEAQDAVANLEEPFKTMAFKRLLEQIAPEDTCEIKIPSKKKVKSAKIKKSIQKIDEETQKIVSSLNRTKYPIVKKLSKSLDLALYTIHIMGEEGYDGLNPSQIVSILNGVFKKNVKSPAIGMALMKADEFTHRIPFTYKGGKSYKYQIMEKGEGYVEKLIEEYGEDSQDNTQISSDDTNTGDLPDIQPGESSDNASISNPKED